MSINRDFADLARSSQPGKNMLINGAMRVSQRGTSFTSYGATDSEYGLDRWKIRSISSASARWTASQESSGGVSGKDKWLKVLNTTADASPGADETQWITQPIEGFNSTSVVADDGTTKSMSVSLDIIAHADGAGSISFPAKVAVFLDMGAGASREYVHDVTIAAADTWERVSFTAPSDSFGTWAADNAANLGIGISLYGGSGRVAAEDTWRAMGRDNITSNTDNWADATNNYLGFTNVQLEVGGPTDFSHEDYGTAIHKARRYYHRIDASTGTTAAPIAFVRTVSNMKLGWFIEPKMRTSPSVETSGNADDYNVNYSGGNVVCSAVPSLVSASGGDVLGIRLQVASGPSAGEACMLEFLSGTATGYLAFDAEL